MPYLRLANLVFEMVAKMEKEMQVALNVIQVYEAARKDGILVLRDYDFECDEIKFIAEVTLNCLRNNISNGQLYEILNNYEEDFENKKIHRLIVNGLMCIISGDNVEYLKELLASILGRNARNEFLERAEKIAGAEQIKDVIIKRYLEKEPFSENTDLPENLLDNADKIKKALIKMSNREVLYILTGVSGQNVVKLLNVMDYDLIKLIDEDFANNNQLQERDIIDAERKLVDIINSFNN